MKNNNIENAMSHIDDDLLESALLMRQRLLENKNVKKSARILWQIPAVAACLVVAVMIPTVAWQAQHQRDRPIVPIVTTTTDKMSSQTTIATDNPPEYVPPFEQPTLEQIYEMEPFCRYAPRTGFGDLMFESSYHALPLDEALMANIIDNDGTGDYMDIKFRDPSGGYLLIRFNKSSNGQSTPGDPRCVLTLYDPSDVESYERVRHELDYYKNVRKAKSEYEQLKDLRKKFAPEDVSLEVIENLFHDTSLFESESEDYLYRCSFYIEIWFEDYVVSYEYYGNSFIPETMYEMITSATYFDN